MTRSQPEQAALFADARSPAEDPHRAPRERALRCPLLPALEELSDKRAFGFSMDDQPFSKTLENTQTRRKKPSAFMSTQPLQSCHTPASTPDAANYPLSRPHRQEDTGALCLGQCDSVPHSGFRTHLNSTTPHLGSVSEEMLQITSRCNNQALRSFQEQKGQK